jgi:hypothetical protein
VQLRRSVRIFSGLIESHQRTLPGGGITETYDRDTVGLPELPELR